MSKKAGTPGTRRSADFGDTWIWRAIALSSRLRVVSHLSHERSEAEAMTFLADFKARTDGHAPLFTSDKLPAYLTALTALYSTPEPPPLKRGRGRPRKEPKHLIDPALCYGQVDKRREGGRVVEVRRQIILALPTRLPKFWLRTDVGRKSIPATSSATAEGVTSRQSNGRLVRKTLSHSKKLRNLQWHIEWEDVVFNFVRPHSALKLKPDEPGPYGRQWEQRTPATLAPRLRAAQVQVWQRD